MVTVSDYLASYQSELMGRIYRFLGMNVGCIIRQAEAAGAPPNVTTPTSPTAPTTSSASRYLRDNMAWEKGRPRATCSHHYAIVGKVDSVLIDRGRHYRLSSGQPKAT